MPSRRGKKSKFKKVLIPVLKWASAIVPICAFIYVLYYYKQFDFLKNKADVKTETQVLTPPDSIPGGVGKTKEELASSVRVVKNEWHPVGGIAIHNMVLENKSGAVVKSAEVEFKYLNEVQSVIASKVITIKTPLPPNQATKISGLSVGYVNNAVVGCDVKVLSIRF